MNFTDTGTLINWQLDDLNIIEPVHDKAGGGSRGGVYLCIPNFEELPPPFSIKHGEYRITNCDSTLPHNKTLGNAWGTVDVITDWEELAEQSIKILNVTTTIRATSETALVRPGFHPYFSVTENSFLDLATTRIEVANLPHDSLQKYQAASLADTVKLTTADYTVTVACSISPATENLSVAFGIWSDKKHEYVCIEPIIGNQFGADDLPTALTLLKGEELVLAFTIRAEKLALAG